MYELPEHAHGCRQLLCVSLVLAMLPTSSAQPSAMWPSAEVVATLVDLELDELSGLVEAERPNTFWTHNDSGDSPALFLIDGSYRRLATHHITGVEAFDVEDIARGPCAKDDPRMCLYVGDIGDNRYWRPHVHIWQLLESAPERPLAVWHVAYPDGPHNAEALVVDPRDATLYILDKDKDGRSKLWRAPRGGDTERPAMMEEVADVSRWLIDEPRVSGRLITAADLSPDGRCIAARTYLDVWTWCAPPGGSFLEALRSASPDRVRTPVMVQSEALAWGREGALWITGEHLLSPMLVLRPDVRGDK